MSQREVRRADSWVAYRTDGHGTMWFWRGPMWSGAGSWTDDPDRAAVYPLLIDLEDAYKGKFPNIVVHQPPSYILFKTAMKQYEIVRRAAERERIRATAAGARGSSRVERLIERHGIRPEDYEDWRGESVGSQPATSLYAPSQSYQQYRPKYKKERVQAIFKETFDGVDVQPKSPSHDGV